jgi:hypothetical protein
MSKPEQTQMQSGNGREKRDAQGMLRVTKKDQFVVVYKVNQGHHSAAHNEGPQGVPHLQPINRIIRKIHRRGGKKGEAAKEKKKKNPVCLLAADRMKSSCGFHTARSSISLD